MLRTTIGQLLRAAMLHDPYVVLVPHPGQVELEHMFPARDVEVTNLKLERTLMGFAYARNPEIANVRDMGYLRNVEVLGLMGIRRAGSPFNEVTQVRDMFGMRRKARP